MVTIECATEGAAILYSTDNGANWIEGNSYTVNEEVTLKAKATKDGNESEIATAHYTIKGNAVFTNGLYTELMTTADSFENMQVESTTGDETWTYNSSYHCAYINSEYNEVDWLITPKMAVENGKLNISFEIWHRDYDEQLSLKWSASNDVVGTWHDLVFDEGEQSKWISVSNIEIETEDPYIYVAFVYDNTSDEYAGQYEIKEFKARQYYNVAFDANNANATGTMAAQACAAGIATALTNNAYTVSGKAFNGWNTAADGSGTDYAEGGNITITENTTLYAQWVDAYTVTLKTNGHLETTMEVKQGNSITLPTSVTPAYVPEGYEFMGWYGGSYFSEDTAPTYIASPYTPSGNITLNAVLVEVASSGFSTGSLTESEITSNITNTTCAYGTPKTYNDTGDGITWVASCHTDAASRPWMQIKKDASDAYIKIEASSAISSVEVTITSASNSSGGINNINKHDPFAGTVYLATSAGTSSSGNVGSANSSEISNHIATITPTGDNSTMFIQVTGGAARIWGITITCGSVAYSNYCTSVSVPYTLTINGYDTGVDADQNPCGYYLIASPVTVDPATVEGMTEGDFDLYYFDQAQDDEWRNYEATPFDLVPGTGYLYAKKATTENPTYSFNLRGMPYAGNGTIDLDYDANAEFPGFNLIGNPFGTNATLDLPYYRLNSDGSALNTSTESTQVFVMEGVFVEATSTIRTATFSPAAKRVSQLNVKVTRNRGAVLDNAIIRFDNGAVLGKFQLNPNSTKVYITEGNQDYAVVRSNNAGEMPVSFKAAENGNYTLSIEAENVEASYLHLIDNMTGADVDLLATPSYTFEANTTDYASRFRLVFSASFISEDADGVNAFAYFNGSSWTISNMGEATLQVVDVMGRVLSSETLSGNAEVSINQSTGVYMLRLVNGDSVKVQKVVVR